MATLYVGGRVFDGEKVLDGHAVLEEGGKVKRVASVGEFAGYPYMILEYVHGQILESIPKPIHWR